MTISRPAYGWRGRVGVIVPPANTTVEPELSAMMPVGVSLHATRLPGRVSDNTAIGLKGRFEEYNRSLAATADSFGGARLSAVCFGVTGSCYLVGHDGEEKLLADLRSSGTSSVITAARAIRQLLAALNRKRIGLVTPYPPWVIELAERYWQLSGLKVEQVVPLPDVVSIYAVNTEEVIAAAQKLLSLSAEVDAIILSGTGVATLPAIERLAEVAKIPVISSNLSLGWWILKAIGIDAASQTPSAALRNVCRWFPSSDS